MSGNSKHTGLPAALRISFNASGSYQRQILLRGDRPDHEGVGVRGDIFAEFDRRSGFGG